MPEILNIYNFKQLKISRLEYFLLLVIFITSVSPLFVGYKPLKLFLVLVLIVLYNWKQTKRSVDPRFYFVMYTYLLLAIIQGVFWDFSLVSFITSFLIILLLPYLLYLLYGSFILLVCEHFIYIFSIVGIVLFTLQSLLPFTDGIFRSILTALEPFNSDDWGSRSMIIYTYRAIESSAGFGRNSGFSHEPGGFATFIIFAITINFVRGISLFNKRNLVYYIALITTFSTAGYLSLSVLVLLLVKQKESRFFAFLIFPFLIVLVTTLYYNLDFMQEKLNEQFESQSRSSLNNETSGRILGARKSINVLLKYPLYGRGLLTVSKPDDSSDSEFADYGWLSYISHFGIVFGFLYMFFFFRGIRIFTTIGNLSKLETFIIIVAIMINLSAQVFINQWYFVIFFYVGMFSNKRTVESEYRLLLANSPMKQHAWKRL